MGLSKPRQRNSTPETVYGVVKSRKPPRDFGYQPIVDFWNELNEIGPTSIGSFHKHMRKSGWRRPQGGELTYEIMRIDMVSMARHGFVRRISG
jgi:hypothetical protein